MKKIASIAVLYAIAPMHACAADDSAYASIKIETSAQEMSVYETRQFIVEKIETLSRFSLLQVNDSFSVYGKLSFPRINHNDAYSGIHRDSATYGLHGQFDSTSRIGIRFGLDRYIAGHNTSGNLYSLTAAVKF